MGEKKNAISMMCIINEHYVIGTCIAGYCHRKMLELAGKKENTDMIILCDITIYNKYQKLFNLPIFFDRVEMLDMRIFPDSPDYNYQKLKYSSWIGASLNKWQSLQFVEYNKIMFVDTAILPTQPDFYDLFDAKTPTLYIRQDADYIRDKKNDNERINCKLNQNILDVYPKIQKDFPDSYDKYVRASDISIYGSVHACLSIMKPDIDMYNKYVKLTDDLFKNGIYSVYHSGPDETTLYYYFRSNNIDVYDLCHLYALIPWDESVLVDAAKSYLFSSFYKPWTKPKFLQWGDEVLWRDIFDIITKKMLHPSSEYMRECVLLKDLYKKTVINTFRSYISFDSHIQHKNFNDKIIKKFKNDYSRVESSIDNDDALFEQIMHFDSKLYVKYYGSLKVDTLLSIL